MNTESEPSTPSAAVAAVRSSHDRLARLLATVPEVTGPSYDTGWTIAQVASHLGSQAEIFELFLDAGVDGLVPPAMEQFRAIWARWDAMEPHEQVRGAVESDEHLVERLEGLDDGEHRFSVEMFGARRDIEAVSALRLGEHALHTWDIEVALDPAATVAPDAVALLLGSLPSLASTAGTPSESPTTLRLGVADPDLTFVLTTGPTVSLRPSEEDAPIDVVLPAEALVRLVYGRLDEAHTPTGVTGAERLPTLRAVFRGF